MSEIANDKAGLVPSEAVLGGDASTLLVKDPVVSVNPRVEDVVSRVEDDVQEDIFNRDVLLLSQTIQVGDPNYVQMLGDFDPFYWYLNDAYIASRLVGFYGVQFGLEITVKCSIPGSCYGLYNLQAICEGGVPDNSTTAGITEYDGVAVDSPWTSTQDEFAFIDCAERQVVTMSLPWVQQKDYFNLRATRTPSTGPRCWRLAMYAMSSLQSTIGTTAVGVIHIYARMSPGYKFTNLVFQGKKKLSSGVGSVGAPKSEAASSVASSGGKYSNFGKTAAKGLATMGAAIPMLAPFAEPAAAGLAAISSVAAMFGFTREAGPKEPRTTVWRQTSSLAQVDGLDTGEVLALTNSNAVSIDNRLGGADGEDVMAFESLFERWTIISKLSFGTSSTGKLLEIPVTPFFANNTLGVKYFTTAGFVGLPFQYWRGGMEYMIYSPSSTNFEGALQVLWDPNEASTGAYPSDPTHRLVNTVINMHGSSCVNIKVGYRSEYPVLLSAPLVAGDTMYKNQVNGKLVFYVQTPLTGPRTGVFATNLIIMARACPDMRFGSPKHYSFSGTVFNQSVRFQAGPPETDMVEMVPDLAPLPLDTVLWGEEVMSVRALCQKFSCYFNVQGGLNITQLQWNHFPGAPRTATGYTNTGTAGYMPFTWIGYYSKLFVGVRGGTRIKMAGVTGGNQTTFAAYPVPYNFGGFAGYPGFDATTGNLNNTHLDLANLTAGHGGEFTYPFYSTLPFFLSRFEVNCFTNTSAWWNRVDAMSSLTNPSTLANVQFLVAGSSDFSATRFRRVPGITLI